MSELYTLLIICAIMFVAFHILRPKINVHHVADDILKAYFVSENWCIFIQIQHPQKFIFKDTVNNV